MAARGCDGRGDGILSTASLVPGVAAAHGTHSSVLIAGIAGLVAGAMSMAAGEYVSVHSQKDTGQADLEMERTELRVGDKGERQELAAIYVARSLDPALGVARDLVERFHAMARSRSSVALDAWLHDAAGSLLGAFANGIAKDREAVAAAITEPSSNGQTEGQITKLKLIKRQMYGRASLDLLRARLRTA
jgi:VIT1/CCC1 family predicted Fe2+/Mn2+ transporter